jgi:hypothetical protein
MADTIESRNHSKLLATEGKARAARNAYRGATRPLLRKLARALRQQNQ